MPQKKIHTYNNKRVGTMGEFLAWSIFNANGSKLGVQIGDRKFGKPINGDLVVDGKTVEVKTSTYSTQGWRFSFACAGGADYLMLFCLSNNYGFKRHYLIPKEECRRMSLPKGLYIKEGGINEKKLEKYKDNLGGLTR